MKVGSEADFQATLVQLAKLSGWMVYHPYDSRRSEAGWPDLVLIKGKVIIFAELKVGKNKRSDAQVEWAQAILGVEDVYYRLWYPEHQDEIEKILTEWG